MLTINTIIILLFYLGIFALIYINRKKFEFHKIGKIPIISMLKTQFGVKFIDKVGKKYSKFLKILGYVGIVIGALGIIAMTYMIASSFLNLFIAPEQASGVSPVIPGVRIPGAQIFVPFWYGIIALFIVIVVHESGHGIIAKAHKLKIKSTGLLLFAILPGAFVEPDEKKLTKAKNKIQQSVYAAGPWFNVLLAILVMLLLLFVISPVHQSLFNAKGFSFTEVGNQTPAQIDGLPVNTTFNKINNISISSVLDLSNTLTEFEPGDKITLSDETGSSYSLVLAEHPEDATKPYMGILNLHDVKGDQTIIQKMLFGLIDIIANLFFWIYVLSLGIGAANLLPIGPLDGGRMLHNFLLTRLKKKKAELLARVITKLTLLCLLGALIVPIVKALI